MSSSSSESGGDSEGIGAGGKGNIMALSSDEAARLGRDVRVCVLARRSAAQRQ